MKRPTPALLIGIVLGVGGTMLAIPALERSRERRIVRNVIGEFGLPKLPAEAIVLYAYNDDEFLFEWYGFEISMTAKQANKWKARADELNSKGRFKYVELDYKIRDSKNVEVRLFVSYK